MSAENGTAPQPELSFVVQALREELAAANENRIYLISVLHQLQSEMSDQRELWELERQSLKAGTED